MGVEVKIEFNSAGFKELLESAEVRDLVESKAQEIKARADANIVGDSEGFRAHSKKAGYGGGRYVAYVGTTDFESVRAESEDKALTRAIK